MSPRDNDPPDLNEQTFIATKGDTRVGADEDGAREERRKIASLIVIEGADIGQEFRLDQGEYYLGRLPNVDIPIYDAKVSRRHAKLVYKRNLNSGREGYEVVDLDSTNGTLLNDSRLTRPAVIQEGDKLQVGGTLLKFTYHDELDSQYHERIRNLINFDNLTGLYTKRYFDHLFQQELLRVQQTRRQLACLMMDLDHFKKVNDTYGHLMGSHVLKEVGAIMLNHLRSQDVVGRYGGEEFVAYLPSLGRVAAYNVANRLREAVASHPFEYDGKKIQVFISIGVSFFPEDGEEAEALVRQADEALYQAKESGRNQVILTQRKSGSAQRD